MGIFEAPPLLDVHKWLRTLESKKTTATEFEGSYNLYF